MIVEEANATGTAYLRLDLLPADAQPELRELFRRYIDVRLATFGGTDVKNARTKLASWRVASGFDETLTAVRRPDASAQATMPWFWR